MTENDPNSIIKTLQYCMVCYYGVYPSNIPTVLIEESCRKIILMFPNLTLEEIKHSFDRLNIEKKEITLNLANIIDPIRKYHQIKYQLSSSLIKLRIEVQKEEIRKQEQLEFENKSIEIYKQSLINKEWKGDIFHANAIAKKYLASKVDQSVKNVLWSDAQLEYTKIKDDLDLFVQNTGVTALRLFSLKIVKHCINEKIEI